MPVRVLKPLLFLPDFILQLMLYISADFFHRRAPVNLFSIFKNFHLEILKRAVLKASFFPVFLRINITNRFGGIYCFVSAGQIIRNSFALFIVNTVDLFQAGIRNLFRCLGNFDFGDELPVFFDGGEFMNSAEYRIGSLSPTPKLLISAP